MNAVKMLLRSLIALPVLAVLWSSAAPVAHAAKTLAPDAAAATAIAGVGFLDVKTFLIGPSARDDAARASERMRLVSPESLPYGRARGWTPDPPAGYPDLLSLGLPKRPRPESDGDRLTVRVNGAPLTPSVGLGDALLRDLDESIRLFGVSGLFEPMPGIASAGLLGNAAGDIVRQIDALESAVEIGSFRYEAAATGTPAGTSVAEPSTLSLFAFGLLVLAWLHRGRSVSRLPRVGRAPLREDRHCADAAASSR